MDANNGAQRSLRGCDCKREAAGVVHVSCHTRPSLIMEAVHIPRG